MLSAVAKNKRTAAVAKNKRTAALVGGRLEELALGVPGEGEGGVKRGLPPVEQLDFGA